MDHILGVCYTNPAAAIRAGYPVDVKTLETRAFLSSLRKACDNGDVLNRSDIGCVTVRVLDDDRLHVVQFSGYNAEDGLYCVCV